MIKSRSTVALSLSILQAFFVFVVWWLERREDISLVPNSLWILMAWSWLAWPVVFIAVRRYWFLALSCLVGVIFISPTATSIWFATSVYFFGFAP